MESEFTVFPAIDLRQGRVVRLQHGDPQRQTIFSQDPLQVARRWARAGAQWLHVVNLDGAFSAGGAQNLALLPRLAEVGPRLQFGGGIRSPQDVQRALDAGVSRVILGTVAVEAPDKVAQIVRHFGADYVLAALDAREGVVRTRGWQEDSGVRVEDLGQRMAECGVSTVIHTDIGRDGVMTGVNARASAALARTTGLRVIASGGVASLEDILRARDQVAAGVVGVITGRALYEGKVDLAKAIAAVTSTES